MSDSGEQSGDHSVIVVDCQDCDDVDTVTKLEYPRDSNQHHAVLDAHEMMADNHHEETGHTVDRKHFGGSPGEMIDVARTHARRVDGVPDDAFRDEVVA
jgi:hypothetical protein